MTDHPNDLMFIAIERRNLAQLQELLHRENFQKATQQRSIFTHITELAQFTALLNTKGYITIKDRHETTKDGTYIDLATRLARMIGADLNDPSCRGLKCTCPTNCDCQDYEHGLVSNECPIHNDEAQPAIDCPQHGHPLFEN